MDLFIQEYRPATDSGSYVCTVTDLSTGARLSTPAASLNVLSKFLSRSLESCKQIAPLLGTESWVDKKELSQRHGLLVVGLSSLSSV